MAPLWKNDSASYALRMTKKIREKKKIEKKIWKKLTKVCTKCLNVCGANCNWIIGILTHVDFFLIQFLPSLYANLDEIVPKILKVFISFHFRVSTVCVFGSQDNGPVLVDFIHRCACVYVCVCVCESAIYI